MGPAYKMYLSARTNYIYVRLTFSIYSPALPKRPLETTRVLHVESEINAVGEGRDGRSSRRRAPLSDVRR